MHATRYSALVLILAVSFAPARSQTDGEGDLLGEPVEASAFADAEDAYAAGDYRRAIAAYRVALDDYGQESDQHASYIYYRTGEAFMRLGYAVPYGTADEFGRTEDYALWAREAQDEAIRLAGIDATDPGVLLEAGRAVTAGGTHNPGPYPTYNLSRTWRLDRKPVSVPGGYVVMFDEWYSLQEQFVHMFVIRALARNVLWDFEGSTDDALVAWTYRDYLSEEEQLDVINTLGDSFLMRGRKEDACLWFQEGVRLAQGIPGYSAAMSEGERGSCNESEDGVMMADSTAMMDPGPLVDGPSMTTERLQFDQGATSAAVLGSVRPNQSVRYLVDLGQGQRVRFSIRTLRGPGDVYVEGYAPGRPVEPRYRLPDDAPDSPAVYEGQPSRSGDYQFVVSSRGGWAVFDVEVEAY